MTWVASGFHCSGLTRGRSLVPMAGLPRSSSSRTVTPAFKKHVESERMVRSGGRGGDGGRGRGWGGSGG